MKQEYPPLLQPGFTDVALDALEELFVEPFKDSSRRAFLVERFRALVAVLQEIGLDCDIWLDGSFTTEKPTPSDIDMVILSDHESLERLASEALQRFRYLIEHGEETKLRYRCDVYFCPRTHAERRSYWRGWFGFTRDEEVKGIARLRLVAS